MSADPPEKGNFQNGDVHTDSSGSRTYNNGIWNDNSGGENNFIEELIVPKETLGKITQDGVMVWGTGADPMDSAIGRDRGQGNIDVGDSDINAFYALLNKVLSYFKDEVIKSNTPKESTLPITLKPEMEIISLYDYTVAPPLGPRGSSAGATVQSRHIKDTMVEKSSSSPVLSRQERIRSQKQYEADSINRRIRK